MATRAFSSSAETAMTMASWFPLDSPDIGVAFAPGRVIHLGQCIRPSRRRREAVVEAHRIKTVTEVRQVREQSNRPAGRVPVSSSTRSRTASPRGLSLDPDGLRAEIARAPAAMRTRTSASRKGRQLIKIQVHHEQAIAELMCRRLCSRVFNSPFVDAAVHWQASPRNAARACSALTTPSS